MPSQYCSSLFPQNRSEFNLSVTKLRDQSGARSDNGMGAGAESHGAEIYLERVDLLGEEKYSKSFCAVRKSLPK